MDVAKRTQRALGSRGPFFVRRRVPHSWSDLDRHATEGPGPQIVELQRERLQRAMLSLPKTELHVHAVGTLIPRGAAKLARENGEIVPESLVAAGPYEFQDLPSFLRDFRAASDLFVTPKQFVDLGYYTIKRLAEQGVTYAEPAFTVSSHAIRLGHSATGWHMPLEQFCTGIDLACAELGVRANVIVDISRSSQGVPFGALYAGRHPTRPDTWERTLETALQFRDRGRGKASVVGLGLAGNELAVGNEHFLDLMARAKRSGLKIVSHAGESLRDPNAVSSLWSAIRHSERTPEALDDVAWKRLARSLGMEDDWQDQQKVLAQLDGVRGLGADRVDHGTAAILDHRVQAELIRRKIPLNLCPASNRLLNGLLPNWEGPHPIVDLHRAGVPVTLNSDDPAFFGTWLGKEYLNLWDEGMTVDEICDIAKNGWNASFGLTERQRQHGCRAVDAWRQDFKLWEKEGFSSGELPTATEYMRRTEMSLRKSSEGMVQAL